MNNNHGNHGARHPMYEVEIIGGFSAAHRLRNYRGKCEHLHGHNYRVHVISRSKVLDQGGMVLDFGHLKKALSSVLERLDHSFLNDLSPFDKIEPSAENIAWFVFSEMESELGAQGALLHCVSVWESDTSRAAFVRDQT
jgi:6-pyruvoyltetrahydropterin/6-carboxytetrahydropterin synthase